MFERVQPPKIDYFKMIETEQFCFNGTTASAPYIIRPQVNPNISDDTLRVFRAFCIKDEPKNKEFVVKEYPNNGDNIPEPIYYIVTVIEHTKKIPCETSSTKISNSCSITSVTPVCDMSKHLYHLCKIGICNSIVNVLHTVEDMFDMTDTYKFSGITAETLITYCAHN